MSRGLAGLGALLLAVAGTGCTQEAAELPLSYDGAATIGEALLPELISGYERTSGKKFGTVALNGSSAGFKAVMEGRVALAGMARSLKSTEKVRNPYYEIIGYDALGVFVHSSNPINALSQKQLKDIFTGKLTRWSELGGPDVPIEPVTENAQAQERGTRGAFQEMVLEGAPFTRTREVDFPRDCVEYVSTHPDAVTYASFVYVMPGVRLLPLDGSLPSAETIRSGEYPLARPLLLISRDVPRGQARIFFEYVLSSPGQAAISKKFGGRTEVR